MKDEQIKVEGMTLAVFKMDPMLKFYSNIFGVEFEGKEMYGGKLYLGKIGSHKLLFCPAEIAQNKSEQNRHQLDIIVNNLDEKTREVTELGGLLMGDISEIDGIRQAGISDPDGNTLVLKELVD